MSKRAFKILKRCTVAAFLGTWALSTALSQQVPGKIDFRRDVQPILKQYCIDCHGPSKQMHGFRLDRRREAMRGVLGVVIKPGNGAGSRLYLKLIGNQYGPQMPLTGPLAKEQIDTIKAWIDQGAEWPDDLSGDTALPPPDPKATRIMEVLRDGDEQGFKKLASEAPGAGNLRGPGGTTPLMQTVLYGNCDAIRLVLANGADPNLRNDAGATALMWAAGNLEKTRLLLESGADVNARSDDGRTPLLIAAGEFGNSEVVKLLLDRGADLSAKSPAGRGYSTALSEAARVGNESLLRMLIERGADVKSAGLLPLLNAYNSPECLETLVKHADRATLTAVNVILAPRGDANTSKTLLERGADVNAKDPQGDTLLMRTANSDAIPAGIIKALIDRGAELNAKNPEGKTALDFARQRGSTAVVDLLVKAGAKEGASSTEPALTPTPAGSPRAAVERSLPLLQKTASTFAQKGSCISCHHNSLTALTVATARRKGFSVNEEIARSQVKASWAFLDLWRERVLQGVGMGGESITIGHTLLGLAAENYPPDATTDAMARFLQSRQLPDGRWQVAAHRPPIESNDDIPVTAIALRSLQVYGPKAQRSRYEMAVKRAGDWLMKAQPRTTQERAFHLLGVGWLGVSPKNELVRTAVRELVREQRSDGGWSQLPSLPSDAYATGQALVALTHSGAVEMTNQSYKRGIEFLVKTQLADGSWYVKSRAIPIQPYFESGFPHGRDQWISAAATNWAAMALAQTPHTKTSLQNGRRATAKTAYQP